MSSATWFHNDGDSLIVSIYVQPGAKQTEVQGLHGHEGEMRLKIRAAAPPLDGRANEELRRFLAATLQVPQRDVVLVSGEKSRSKRFSIRGGRADALLILATKS